DLQRRADRAVPGVRPDLPRAAADPVGPRHHRDLPRAREPQAPRDRRGDPRARPAAGLARLNSELCSAQAVRPSAQSLKDTNMPTPKELEAKFWSALKSDMTMMLGLADAEDGHTRPMTAQIE